MSLRELADRVDKDAPTVCRWETGERVITPQQATHVLAVLGVDRGGFRRVMRLCTDLDHPCWIATTDEEQHIQRDAYLALTAVATHITELAPRCVPPLLRTREVAAGIAWAGEVPADQAVAHVAALRERQRPVLGKSDVDITVFLGTAALVPPTKDAGGFAAQLDHLLRLAAHPRIDLRLTPTERGESLGQAVTVTRTPHTTFAVTHVRRSILWLHRGEELDSIAQDIQDARAAALSHEESVAGIAEALERLRRGAACGLTRAG